MKLTAPRGYTPYTGYTPKILKKYKNSYIYIYIYYIASNEFTCVGV